MSLYSLFVYISDRLLNITIYKTRKPSIFLPRSILDLFLGFLLRHAGLFLDLLGMFFIITGGKQKGHAYDHYDHEDR